MYGICSTRLAMIDAGDRRAGRGQRARQHAERRELGQQALEHRGAIRAERAQHGAFVAAFFATRLHGRDQHDEARDQREQEDALHGGQRLVDDRTHLAQQVVHVEHRNAREAPHEIGDGLGILGLQVRRRHPRALRALEQTRREHQEEVRLEAVPLHLAHARDLGGARLAGDVELQLVAELELQLFHVFGRHRNQRLAEILAREPVSRGDLVVVAEHFRPGDVLVASGELRPRGVANLMSSIGLPLMCVMRARTIGSARARCAPRSSRNAVNCWCSSGGMLMKKKFGVSAGRLRRQSFEQIVAHHREQQQHHDAVRERRELHHALGAPAAEVGDAVAPGHADAAAKARS